MGQTDILEFLQKNPGQWFSATQIGKGIGVTNPHKSLWALRGTNFIKVKKMKLVEFFGRMAYVYKHKGK